MTEERLEQEELTADLLPPPIDEQPHEFTEQPTADAEGLNINLSELLPVMVAGLFFGDGGTKPDGTELTNEERAAAFTQQAAMLMNIIGFDDAVADVMPGVADNVNPLYVVGGGFAVMLGLAYMMRPPKKKQNKTATTAGADEH